jgi:hypothetical protein
VPCLDNGSGYFQHRRYNDNDLLIKHRFLAEADKSDIDSQADNADIDSQVDNADIDSQEDVLILILFGSIDIDIDIGIDIGIVLLRINISIIHLRINISIIRLRINIGFDAGTGDDLLYLGGTNNNVTGGEGADVFIIGKDNLSSKLTIDSQDYIVFDLDYKYICPFTASHIVVCAAQI